MGIKIYDEFEIRETIITATYEHFERYENTTTKIVATGSYEEIIKKYNILKKNEENLNNYKKKYYISSIGISDYLKKYGDNKTDLYFKLGFLDNYRTVHYIPIGMIRDELEEILNSDDIKYEIIKSKSYKESEEYKLYKQFCSKLKKIFNENRKRCVENGKSLHWFERDNYIKEVSKLLDKNYFLKNALEYIQLENPLTIYNNKGKYFTLGSIYRDKKYELTYGDKFEQKLDELASTYFYSKDYQEYRKVSTGEYTIDYMKFKEKLEKIYPGYSIDSRGYTWNRDFEAEKNPNNLVFIVDGYKKVTILGLCKDIN